MHQHEACAANGESTYENHIHYMEIVQFFIHKHLTTKIVARTSEPFVVNSRHDLARSLTRYCRLISVCICYVVVAAFCMCAHIVAIDRFFCRAAITLQQVNVGMFDLRLKAQRILCKNRLMEKFISEFARHFHFFAHKSFAHFCRDCDLTK